MKAGQPQWPFIKADCSFIKAGQPMAVLLTIEGRFINQKRAKNQICRFGLRMVDFILSRTSSLSTARSSLFRKSWQTSGRFIRPANRNGRFIKASLFESFLKAPHKASSKFSFKAPRKAS